MDPVLVRHAITNYNLQTQNKGMKSYWVSEWNIQSILDHLQPQQQLTFQNNLSKINSINDIDLIVISFAKIKRLKKIKVRNRFEQHCSIFFNLMIQFETQCSCVSSIIDKNISFSINSRNMTRH